MTSSILRSALRADLRMDEVELSFWAFV